MTPGRARRTIGFAIASFATLSPARAEIFERGCGPGGRLLVSRPEIRWEVWSTGSDRIAGAAVLLNGNPVPARYDPSEGAVVALVEGELPAGAYAVQAKAVFERGFSVKREWTFEIADAALERLPELDATQREALSIVNGWRERMGLAPFRGDLRLCAAARGHSEYNARNRTTGHYQTQGKPGFFGEGPAERAEAFGYFGGCYEAVSRGYATLSESIEALIDAPYHRIPFMQPGSLRFGSGFLDERLTLAFELTAGRGTSAYPYDGQEGVPTRWDRLERPNPLRIHKGFQGIAGYPIVLAHFSGDARLTLISAELRAESGEAIPLLANTPENDGWLKNAVILIPASPLGSLTRYQVSVEARSEDGTAISRTWSFTTRDTGSGPASRHAPVIPRQRATPPQGESRLRVIAQKMRLAAHRILGAL